VHDILPEQSEEMKNVLQPMLASRPNPVTRLSELWCNQNQNGTTPPRPAGRGGGPRAPPRPTEPSPPPHRRDSTLSSRHMTDTGRYHIKVRLALARLQQPPTFDSLSSTPRIVSRFRPTNMAAYRL
jgi:hypothetical protein